MSHIIDLLTNFFTHSDCHTLKTIYELGLSVSILAGGQVYVRWSEKNGDTSTKLSLRLFELNQLLFELTWLSLLLVFIMDCKKLLFFSLIVFILIVFNCMYFLVLYSDIYFSDERDSDEGDIEK